MANEIKIGINSIDSFKVGVYDCQIFLGTVKLYPQDTPVTKDYLRTVAKSNGTISLVIGSAVTTSDLSYVAYSLDSGSTWTTVNNVDSTTITASTNVNSGDVVYWKGEGTRTANGSAQYNGVRYTTILSSTASFDVEGNAMSLLFGDNFENQEFDSASTYHLSSLFYSATTLVNASGMTLPATTVYENDYNDMFNNCSGLISAPSALSATTIGASSYKRMFQDCTSLTAAPQISATTVGNESCVSMFAGCTSLVTAPSVLPATTLGNKCCEYMFRGCTSLTTAPSSIGTSASTIAAIACTYMFSGCTSLEIAPELPIPTLTSRCYAYMFAGCRSLRYIKCLATSGISPGATSSSNNTYYWVDYVPTGGTFYRPTEASSAWGTSTTNYAGIPSGWSVEPAIYSWRTAPNSDYDCVTSSSENTKYKVEYYSVSDDNGRNWEKVQPEQRRRTSTVIEYDSYDCGYRTSSTSGTPYCNGRDKYVEVTTVASRDYGVTWSSPVVTQELVEAYSPDCTSVSYFTIRSLANGNTITLKNNMVTNTTTSFEYSLDDGTTWTSFSLAKGSTKTIATLASGDTVMMRGTNDKLGTSYNYGHFFRGTQDYEIEGSIASLVNGNNTDLGLASGSTFTFAQLFSGDTHLVNAENLVIGSAELPQSCFNSTFRSCTRLVKAPELPSTVLGKEAYSSMFESCTSLAYPPSQLYFTSVQSDSYNRMFCMSRSSKITTPAMTYTPKMFGNWGSVNPATSNMQMFCGNGNLTNIYCYWTNTSGSFGNIANWVNYTADSGVTFYKRSTQSFQSGVNGIKARWTVVNDDTTQPS